MNPRNAMSGALAGLALVLSLGALIAMAQTEPITAGTTATVVLTEGGQFELEFCGPVWLSGSSGFSNPFGVPIDITSASGGAAFGGFGLCYTDTQSYRDGFTVSIDAGDFDSGVPQPYGGPNYLIPAENFKLTTVYNPGQGQWGITADGYHIGDIGGYDGGGGTVTSGTAPWVGPPLSDNPQVNYGHAGTGTGSGTLVLGLVDGTISLFLVKLDVPAGAHSGLYVSPMTVTLTWGTP